MGTPTPNDVERCRRDLEGDIFCVSGFLHLGIIDILGERWECPVHYRMFSSILGFYLLDTIASSFRKLGQQTTSPDKCLLGNIIFFSWDNCPMLNNSLFYTILAFDIMFSAIWKLVVSLKTNLQKLTKANFTKCHCQRIKYQMSNSQNVPYLLNS